MHAQLLVRALQARGVVIEGFGLNGFGDAAGARPYS